MNSTDTGKGSKKRSMRQHTLNTSTSNLIYIILFQQIHSICISRKVSNENGYCLRAFGTHYRIKCVETYVISLYLQLNVGNYNCIIGLYAELRRNLRVDTAACMYKHARHRAHQMSMNPFYFCQLDEFQNIFR